MAYGKVDPIRSLAARDLRSLLRLLRSPEKVAFGELIRLWKARDQEQWSRLPAAYTLLAERMLREGEPLVAYDVVREGLHLVGSNIRLRQLQGIALARSGSSMRAGEIFSQLRAERHLDEETLGMLARTYKDAAMHAADPKAKRRFLQKAAIAYENGYRLSRGFWTGINAATMALLLSRKTHAGVLAGEIRKICLRALRQERNDRFWLFATLGEAALVTQQWSEAEDWYRQAGDISERRFGDLQSSRRNARLLLDFWRGSHGDRNLSAHSVGGGVCRAYDRRARSRPTTIS